MKKLLIGLLGVLLLLGVYTFNSPIIPPEVSENPPVEAPTTPASEDTSKKQVSFHSSDPLGIVWTRLGQRLTIPNEEVTGLAFYLCRVGTTSGDVTFAIRDMEDNIIVSKVWGDASDVPEVHTWLEVTFDSPVTIDGEVRLSCEWEGGTPNNCLWFSYYSGNRKSGECYTNYSHQWHDIGEAEEANYRLLTSVVGQILENK